MAVAALHGRAIEVAAGSVVGLAVTVEISGIALLGKAGIADGVDAEACDAGDGGGDGVADDAAACDFDCSAVLCGDRPRRP